MIIFSRFFREFNMFSIENFKFYFKSWTFQGMSNSKGDKVDQSERVTLPVKFACKQELTLTRLLGNPSTRGTLSPRKQALRKHQHAEHAAIQTSCIQYFWSLMMLINAWVVSSQWSAEEKFASPTKPYLFCSVRLSKEPACYSFVIFSTGRGYN